MGKKIRRKISIKIHGRLVDTDYNDSIATLCSVVMRSATCQRPESCYTTMSTWLGKTDKEHMVNMRREWPLLIEVRL